MPLIANGVPFDMSHVRASGNIGADMHADAMTEGTGRVPGSRLCSMSDDAGMKAMLALIASSQSHSED